MATIDVIHVFGNGFDFGYAVVDNGNPVNSFTFRFASDAYCFALGYASSLVEGLRIQRDFLQGELERTRVNAKAERDWPRQPEGN